MQSESRSFRKLERAKDDPSVLNEIVDKHRLKLKRLIEFRLHPQLRRRIDSSDVIQAALLECVRKYGEYSKNPGIPFYAWLRKLTLLKLSEFHVRHLDAKKRDIRREVAYLANAPTDSSTSSFVFELAGKSPSPSSVTARAELQLRVKQALSQVEDADREVLFLRHFEQLSFAEIAYVLGMSKSGVSGRYFNALGRVREELKRLGVSSDLF